MGGKLWLRAGLPLHGEDSEDRENDTLMAKNKKPDNFRKRKTAIVETGKVKSREVRKLNDGECSTTMPCRRR
jgi:hypothetical protein